MATTPSILSGAITPDIPRAPVAGRQEASRWRYELERAQRLARATNADGAVEQSGSEHCHGIDGATARESGPPSEATPLRGRAEAQVPKLADQSPTMRASAQALLENKERGEQRPSTALAQRARPTAVEAKPPADKAATPRAQRAPWPRFHLHLLRESDEVSIWLRDTSVAPEEARRLRAELEPRLRALQRRLVEFVVNGESIDPLQRSMSWRSKP